MYGKVQRLGEIDPAEMANLIYAAVGEPPRPNARAVAALDTLLDRIPEEVAQRTLRDIAALLNSPVRSPLRHPP